MRFLVDANLPRSAISSFIQRGHQADHVRDIGLGDSPDSKLAAHAQSSGAVLVTRDLDFADIRTYPPAEYHGFLVLRISDNAIAAEILAALERFLSEPTLVAQLDGRLAILEKDRVRFRPALKQV